MPGKKIGPRSARRIAVQVSEDEYATISKIASETGLAVAVLMRRLALGYRPEAPRSREFPLPPLPDPATRVLFAKAAREIGYKTYSLPGANCSEPYQNIYGCQLGP